MPSRFVGRAFLVTGSTSGIGECIARRIASEGAAVTIHGLDATLASTVGEEIRQTGGKATSVAGDLRDPLVPAKVVEHHMAAFGHLDGLVNNAGISTRSDLETTTPELFHELMTINALAPLQFVQAAHAHLRNGSSPSIVNIGSVNAHAGASFLLAYSMSKGALMTLSRNLAGSLAKDRIRVNQINVGWTLTENEREFARVAGKPEDWPEKLDDRFIPLGRIMHPQDIASMVLYLLSEESELLSGQVIEFDQRNRFGI